MGLCWRIHVNHNLWGEALRHINALRVAIAIRQQYPLGRGLPRQLLALLGEAPSRASSKCCEVPSGDCAVASQTLPMDAYRNIYEHQCLSSDIAFT
ncbi:hypothetical protein [Nostoc flagelliforme]|uniref:hypothetical protein n=1 Tax=Nostoc flagelliforme TaxID=1306274 RepID=UPI0012FDF493|nr:hypothetical protein [Nostoc flagelliforme]